MPEKQSVVTELAARVRDLVNQPRRNALLRRSPASWRMLCSCLDVIEDTELALAAYETAEEPSSPGACYLLLYGTLQALFVQQDAVSNLADALGTKMEPSPLLSKIREIRNDAVGHPTKRGSGTGRAYNAIVRISMTKEGFDLLTTYPDADRLTSRKVLMSELIEEQRASLGPVLLKLEEEMALEEEQHKARFRGDGLSNAFPETLQYHISKLFPMSLQKYPEPMTEANLAQLEQALSKFREAIAARDLTGALPGIDHVLESLEHPMKQMGTFIRNRESSQLTRDDIPIFISFIRDGFTELQQMAKEVDTDYEGSTGAT